MNKRIGIVCVALSLLPLMLAATATSLVVPVGNVTGLGSGVSTFLATPTSANLASAITNETGSGALVFGTSPALTTPTLGAATATTLSVGATPSPSYVLNSSGAALITSASAWADGQTAILYFGDSGAGLTIPWRGPGAWTNYNGLTFTNTNGSITCLSVGACAAGSTGGNANVGVGGVTADNATARLQVKGGTADNTASGLNITDSSTVTTFAVRNDGQAKIGAGGVAGTNTKNLTESSATAFVQIGVASGSSLGGCIHYEIVANDASDFQNRSGTIHFSIVNKAGTLTANIGTVINESIAVSTGTLTNSFDTSNGTNLVNIRANAVSSLTQTTLAIKYRVEIFDASATVTPQ
jgi:hypothetical protein